MWHIWKIFIKCYCKIWVHFREECSPCVIMEFEFILKRNVPHMLLWKLNSIKRMFTTCYYGIWVHFKEECSPHVIVKFELILKRNVHHMLLWELNSYFKEECFTNCDFIVKWIGVPWKNWQKINSFKVVIWFFQKFIIFNTWF